MNGANMEEIVKMAQQVASNIATNQTEPMDPKNMDMSKVLSQVTESVSKMMTPELLEKMSGGNMENINQNIEVPKDLKTKSYSEELMVPLISRGKHKLRILVVPDDEGPDMNWEYELDFTITDKEEK